MLSTKQIADLFMSSRTLEEFARACELAGRREQQKLDAARAKKFEFSPCIGSAIAEEILRAE